MYVDADGVFHRYHDDPSLDETAARAYDGRTDGRKEGREEGRKKRFARARRQQRPSSR